MERYRLKKSRIQWSYINKVDPIAEKQFSAITIIMPDDTIYVAYRGTDTSIVGDKFIKAEITNSSEFIDKTITKWLSGVNTEQRKIKITLFGRVPKMVKNDKRKKGGVLSKNGKNIWKY